MIERTIEFSVRHRSGVIFAVLLIAAVGLRAAQHLPIDAVPDVTNVQVQVLTTAPALGPLEVEQFITFPVETVMSGLPNLKETRSISRFGLSAVTLVFDDDTDIYFARQQVAERLGDVRDAIPEGYGSPEMGPVSTGLGEIFQFEVHGDPMCTAPAEPAGCYSLMDLRSILDWTVAYHLRLVPGVVEVNTFGGELKTYEVQLDPERLRALDISLDAVFAALAENNANAGGGNIAHAGEQTLIRGEALIESLDDIRRIVVGSREAGTPITIGALGRVGYAPMLRQGAVTRDGRGEAVIGIAMMRMGENSREVSAALEEKLAAIQPTLPEGVTLDVFYNRTALVDRTIRTVATNLFEGGALVIVVLLLLLGNIRGGLLVATAIPLSMLGAFIAMRHFGVSANLMSLGAIDFGLIVDGSVVIVENVVRSLHSRNAKVRDISTPAAISQAAGAVGRPVAFAVAIIMLVYVPVLALSGVEGKMFKPMALTVIFAIGTSLVLALTWVPALSVFVFRNGAHERDTWLMQRLRNAYTPLLQWALARPRAIMGGSGLFLVLSLALVPWLGAEFVPTLDEGALAMHAIRLPSVALEESVAATTRVEQVLLEHFPDEITSVVSKTGRPEIATDPMGVEVSDVIVALAPKGDWQRADTKAELQEAIEAVLSREIAGQAFSFSQPIEMRMNELISGVRSDVALSIYGEDLDTLQQVGAQAAALLRRIPGAADVKAETVAGLPVLRVQVKRDAIARYGIHAKQVLDAVATLGGKQVGEVFEGQKRFALQVRFAPHARDHLEAIRRLPIAAPNGQLIPLGQLARLELEDGPAQISRHHAQRRLTVEANVEGRDLASFVGEAKAAIGAAGILPKNYFVAWGGQFENLEEASERLATVVPAALLLIFFLLYATYGSARPALLIYLNVPFAATGGILALFLRDMPFSISAAIGFIALFGVAVLNGVVLMSHLLELEEAGVPHEQAVHEGALDRLRPVMMTASVAALGFLPMALSASAGAEVQRPLATVVIGGLVTSTWLTLLVLPAVCKTFGVRRAPRAELPVEETRHKTVA